MDQLLPLLFGGVLGGVLTYVAQSYFSIRSQDIELINDFIADIGRIEEFSTEYWLSDSKKDFEKQKDTASKIRGALHSSSVFYNTGKSLLAGDWQEFERLDGILYDRSTGGLFESKSQIKDRERVVDIMKCVNEIKILMRRARRKLYWAR